MINPLNELSSVYLAHIAEQEGDNTPEDVKTRVMQIVKAIRYKARKEGGNIVKAFNDYMGGQSGIGAAERQMIKQRLGLQEEVGITTSEKIKKALKDQELKRKEEAAVEKAKKIRKEEVVNEKLDYDPMDDPDFDPREAEKNRGVSGKNNPKGGKKLKDLTKEEVVNEIIDPKGARRQDAAKPKKEIPLTPEQKAKRDKANKLIDKEYYRPNPKEYPTMWKKRESTSEEKGFNFIKKFMKEDEAYKNVVARLKKQHGDSGVLASKKDFERAKAKKPQTAKQIQQKDDRSAAQREVDAQYGRTPWNKKGSLGT